MNARVNHKLYCTKLVLDAALTSEGATANALLEAALFHLVTAYRCYLHEIVGIDAPHSARDAAQQCQQLGLEPKPELYELAQLERTGVWPQLLLDAYAAITVPNISNKKAEPGAVTGIALADMTVAADQANCREWLEQFQRLLQRQREHSREW